VSNEYSITEAITVTAVNADGELVTRTYTPGTVAPSDDTDAVLLGLAFDGGVVACNGDTADIAAINDDSSPAQLDEPTKRARKAATTKE
jgi:hypothetical protein